MVICSHQAESPLQVCLISDLVICNRRNEHGHTWHRMPLAKPDVIKQHKLKFKLCKTITILLILAVMEYSVTRGTQHQWNHSCGNPLQKLGNPFEKNVWKKQMWQKIELLCWIHNDCCGEIVFLVIFPCFLNDKKMLACFVCMIFSTFTYAEMALKFNTLTLKVLVTIIDALGHF